MKSAILIVLFLSLSGCLSGSSSSADETSNGAKGTIFIDLSWIPIGDDFIVREVAYDQAGHLPASLGGGVSFPRSIDDPPSGACFPIAVAGVRHSVPFFIPDLYPLADATEPGITVQQQGQSIKKQVRLTGAGMSFASVYLGYIDSQAPGYVIFGVSDADYWKKAGSNLFMELDILKTATVSTVYSGRLDCRTDLSETESGSYIAAPVGLLGSDLHFNFGETEGIILHRAMTDGQIAYRVGNNTDKMASVDGSPVSKQEIHCQPSKKDARIENVEGVRESVNRLDLLYIPLPRQFMSAFPCAPY